MTALPMPAPGRTAALAFVATHLADLASGPVAASAAFAGGQRAADGALAQLDIGGYASKRNEVWPESRRGASGLSPYIRHGLLQLDEVWRAAATAPARDASKFRDELLWQEFARHWYAHHGSATRHGTRRRLVGPPDLHADWDRSMACIDMVMSELHNDGWLVNQTRMWLASHWALRLSGDWKAGEDEFFRHLIDGSRAANRLGWQWTTGTGSSKHYGFSRWQVNKRAPGLCDSCEHKSACPIEDWPPDPSFEPSPSDAKSAPTMASHGPSTVRRVDTATAVWLTAESLGTADPALRTNPDLPVIFVWDQPLLDRLQLSAKRLVFLTETLAELAEHRDVTMLLGDPAELLSGKKLAVTFAPVPGFVKIANAVQPVEVRPWPWLCEPVAGSVSSFSAWRKNHERAGVTPERR